MASAWGETAGGRGGDDTSTPEPQTTSPAEGGLVARLQTGRGVAAAATVAFLVVQLIEVWSARPTKNTGDLALIEMETRRVFSVGPPLLGAYSRYGWRHPGGALFWVWSPVYELFGESARALSTAAACLVALSLWWLCTRWSTNRGFNVALGVAALVTIGTLSENGVAYAWNINATVVPVLVVLAGCATTIVTARPSIPMLATTGWWLFVFEAHAGTGVVLAPAVLATLAVVAVRRLRGRWEPADRRSLVLGSVVVALIGSPVVIDAAIHRGGNLRSLLVWSATNDVPTAGLATGVKVVGRATSLSFVTAPQQPRFLFNAVIVWGLLPGLLLVLGAAALLFAVRRRDRLATAALAILGVTWGSAVFAVANIPDPVYAWLVTWLQPLAWMTWAIVIWVALSVLPTPTRRSDWQRRASGLGGAMAGAWAVAIGAGALAAIGSGSPVSKLDRSQTQVTALADAVRSEAGPGLVAIKVEPEFAASDVIAAGLLNDLDRGGVTACADPQWDYKVPERWNCRPTMADATQDPNTFVVRTEEVRGEPPPGMRLIADVDYLEPTERRRVDEARFTVLTFLDDRGRTDLDALVGTELTHLILADPDLRIDDPGVLEAIDTLSWAAAFDAQRYLLFAPG